MFSASFAAAATVHPHRCLFSQAFAEGKGAVAAAQQRQRLPYLVTVARQSPLGFSRPATDSGRWLSQQGTSSSLERTGGSAGPLAEEVGRQFWHAFPALRP